MDDNAVKIEKIIKHAVSSNDYTNKKIKIDNFDERKLQKFTQCKNYYQKNRIKILENKKK